MHLQPKLLTLALPLNLLMTIAWLFPSMAEAQMLAPQMKSVSGSAAQQTNTVASAAIAPNDAASVGHSNIDATSGKNVNSGRRDSTSRRRNNPNTRRSKKAAAKPLFKETLSTARRSETSVAENRAGLIPSSLVQGNVTGRQTAWAVPADRAAGSARRGNRPRLLPKLNATENVAPAATKVAAPTGTKRIANHDEPSKNSTSRATYVADGQPLYAPRRSNPLTPLKYGRATHIAAIPSILVQDDKSAADTEGSDASDSQNDDALQPLTDTESEDDAEADAEAATLRLQYASDLYAPLSTMPVQRAGKYLDQAGLSLDDKHAVSYFRSVGPQVINTENTRRSADGQYWVSTYAMWKSPNLAHRPLYFEDANLERFGGERRGQLLFSAAHFFASVATLPYQIGQNPGNDLYYVSGYGRPGNEYCLRRERPVWNRRGASLQALITNAIVFGLL